LLGIFFVIIFGYLLFYLCHLLLHLLHLGHRLEKEKKIESTYRAVSTGIQCVSVSANKKNN
jgi:hypothetical protein